jgi:WD40 repeat protein
MKAILADHDFPLSFSKKVEQEAQKVKNEVLANEIKKRRDYRDVLTFTIDPFDAKDYDDAISYKKLENGNHEVGVHIADVSHYVQPGGAIDEEAYNRGTSIYLVDRVIPMLPEALSNFVCSLRPDEEKLCFAAIFEMDDDAKILNEWFGKTVIRSNRRFAYEEVQKIIEENFTYEKFRLINNQSEITDLAITPNDEFIFTASIDNKVYVWKSDFTKNSFELVNCINNIHNNFITSLCLDPSLEKVNVSELSHYMSTNGVKFCTYSDEGKLVISETLPSNQGFRNNTIKEFKEFINEKNKINSIHKKIE